MYVDSIRSWSEKSTLCCGVDCKVLVWALALKELQTGGRNAFFQLGAPRAKAMVCDKGRFPIQKK